MPSSASKMPIEDLNRLIADPTVSERDLAPYFVVDEGRSTAFGPALDLNPATVRVPSAEEARVRGDVLLSSANGLARLRRRWAFEARIAGGYDGPVLVSEGDSWFQYPIRLEDVVDHLMKDYAVCSLDAAGDTLQHMFDQKEYLPAIRDTRASVFLFSGGGNDVLGGGNLKEHLRDFDPSLAPADHVLPSYRELLDHAVALYDRIFRSVEDAPGDIVTVCHGYDYVVPNGGRWLGRPMEERGIEDRAFQKRITDTLVDRFNARLKVLADSFPRVTYLDLRGTVGADANRWDDELHPTSAAFGDVAERFKTAIEKASPRSLREVLAAERNIPARGADRRTPAPARRRAGAAAVRTAQGRGRVGLSLHIGLNEIDPAHYGTDGALEACEFDAESMQGIAEAGGFEVLDRLNGSRGTRAALKDGLGHAAKELKGGDIFMLTYAGHGSQVNDYNRDEDDECDETLCLYDAMLIDDELYALWRAFADDVRVLVVSDSCHSGTVIRATPFGPALVGRDEPKPRFLSKGVAGRAIRRNRAFYEDIFRETQALSDGALVKELSFPLRCSVLLLSGCMDNQVSRDGDTNGRFTQELLRVWEGGRFEGDYNRFLKTIRDGMPEDQSPNLMTAGRPNPAFLGQRPFSV